LNVNAVIAFIDACSITAVLVTGSIIRVHVSHGIEPVLHRFFVNCESIGANLLVPYKAICGVRGNPPPDESLSDMAAAAT